jgi:hypothetical protein
VTGRSGLRIPRSTHPTPAPPGRGGGGRISDFLSAFLIATRVPGIQPGAAGCSFEARSLAVVDPKLTAVGVGFTVFRPGDTATRQVPNCAAFNRCRGRDRDSIRAMFDAVTDDDTCFQAVEIPDDT